MRLYKKAEAYKKLIIFSREDIFVMFPAGLLAQEPAYCLNQTAFPFRGHTEQWLSVWFPFRDAL